MISIVMGYRSRPEAFQKTLESYRYFYKDLEYEICLIDDTPDDNHCEEILLNSGIPYQYKKVNRADKKFRNPGLVYNMAVYMAKYPVIHITNPENIHFGPLLIHALDHIKDNNYLVYGCRSLIDIPTDVIDLINNPNSLVDYKDGNEGWYQHTKKNNRLLHFASIMYTDLFKSIGGFNGCYENGVGFEDNDFVQTVLSNKIEILAFDDPFVGHQRHDRSYMMEFWDEGYHRNAGEYLKRWGEFPPNHREGW